MNAWEWVLTQPKCSQLCSPEWGFLNWACVLKHLDLHTYTSRQLLIRASNRSDVCSWNWPNPRESNSKGSHVKAESGHRSSKRRSNFNGAEVEVLLQDVDFSILFQYGYINVIEFSAYLFIHLHLQCSCSAFIYFRTSRCLIESWLYIWNVIVNDTNLRISVELMWKQSPTISHRFSP